MSDQTEDRLRRLERFRYSALARINVCQSIAVGAWGYICLEAPDPLALTKAVTDARKEGSKTMRSFPGADPAHLDLLSQEYQEAVDAVSKEVLAHVQKAIAKSGPRNNG